MPLVWSGTWAALMRTSRTTTSGLSRYQAVATGDHLACSSPVPGNSSGRVQPRSQFRGHDVAEDTHVCFHICGQAKVKKAIDAVTLYRKSHLCSDVVSENADGTDLVT
jgi:hypothetical protein